VVGYRSAHLVHAEDVVVVHVILVSVVVVLDVRLAVVGGVDVEFAIEDVGRWISRVQVRDDGGFVGHGNRVCLDSMWWYSVTRKGINNDAARGCHDAFMELLIKCPAMMSREPLQFSHISQRDRYADCS